MAATKFIAERRGVHLQAATSACIAATVLVAAARRIVSCKVHAGDVPRSIAAERVDQAHAVAATLVGAVWQCAWHTATLQQVTSARWNWARFILGRAGIAGDTSADAVPLGVAAIRILRTDRGAARRIVACAAVMGAAAIAGADIAAHVTASARSDSARNINAIRVPFRVAAVGVFCAYSGAAHGIAGCSAWVWFAGWSGAVVAAHWSYAHGGVGWQRGQIDAFKVPSNGAAAWVSHAHSRAAQALVATRQIMLHEATAGILQSAGTSATVQRASRAQCIPGSTAAQRVVSAHGIAAIRIVAVGLLVRNQAGLVASRAASNGAAAIFARDGNACAIPVSVTARCVDVAHDGAA
ncbi:MAG TPA: hypothetical protein DCR70_03860 [Phycisphaerales bacterium]|nr:hypothetical protein [Phycisphaerales bacterium]